MEVSSLSLRHGVRCVPDAGATVEDVLMAIGEQTGFENIVSASKMNKAVVIFLKDQSFVSKLIVSGVWVSGAFVTVSPLVSQSTRVNISNCPPYIPNACIENELQRFGKIVSEMTLTPLRCKNEALKHVLSFRRQLFMVLESPTLDISFRVKHEDKSYMIYASTNHLKCFECGNFGHKKMECPHKTQTEENTNKTNEGEQAVAGEAGNVDESNETETDNRTDKEQSGNNKLSAHEQSESTEGIEQKESSEKKLGKKNEKKNNCDGENKRKNCEEAGISDVKKSHFECSDHNVEDIVENQIDNISLSQLSKITDVTEEMTDDDCLSEMSDFPSNYDEEQLYTVKEINDFLDETFGRKVEVKDFFPDVKKFLASVIKIQKTVSYEELSRRKRFRLKKMVTNLRKEKNLENSF